MSTEVHMSTEVSRACVCMWHVPEAYFDMSAQANGVEAAQPDVVVVHGESSTRRLAQVVRVLKYVLRLS